MRIGFMLDVLPPAPGDQRSYYPDPAGAGPYLANASAVLGVLGFIPEIGLHSSDEAAILAYKRDYLQGWIGTGIPTILDASLGYYATLWNDPQPVRYGNNPSWRQGLSVLRSKLPVRGVAINCWNGYTEGYAAVPSVGPASQDQDPQANRAWIATL